MNIFLLDLTQNKFLCFFFSRVSPISTISYTEAPSFIYLFIKKKKLSFCIFSFFPLFCVSFWWFGGQIWRWDRREEQIWRWVSDLVCLALDRVASVQMETKTENHVSMLTCAGAAITTQATTTLLTSALLKALFSSPQVSFDYLLSFINYE